MKHLKKLKRKQKELLADYGYNASEYLCERDTTEKTVFVNVKTDKVLEFYKVEGVFKC